MADSLNIKIDPDAFSIEDMAFIMSLSDDTPFKDIIIPATDVMRRVVVGGVKNIPASRFQETLAEVVRQWSESANPKSAPAG